MNRRTFITLLGGATAPPTFGVIHLLFAASARDLFARTHQGKRRNMMHRRNMLSISAITALGFALMPGNAVSQQKSLKDQLVGAWTLVSTKYKFPDGTMVDTFGSNPRGILIFDASGRVAFIAMRGSLPKFAAN